MSSDGKPTFPIIKTVFHLMYADYQFDVDVTFSEITEILPFLTEISKQGIKPRPVFQKGDFAKKESNIGKMGEIKFIDEGKTKGGKPCFFVRILEDGLPDTTAKSDMIEIMQMPMTKGKKLVCMWNVGDRVVVIKNDAGFLDLDDATDMTADMTEEEKKS